MTNVDSQRIKEIRDNTGKMADSFARIAYALEEIAMSKDEPRSSQIIDAYSRGWSDGADAVVKTVKEIANEQ